MQMLYNFFIQLYTLGFKVFSLFNTKAKKGLKGRENWEQDLRKHIQPNQNWIWMHCSSLGEFEQGRPIFDKLKEQYPNHKLALSFFSPSGYEIRKNYGLADLVFYLPFDTPTNAQKLSGILKPAFLILVKYDYWYNHLKYQHTIGTKIVVVSAIFRESQVYFKPHGKWMASNLKKYVSHFFVQDEKSKSLLQKINIDQVTVSGDTRFDRVKTIAAQTQKLDWVEDFKANFKLIVIGSSWKDDEDLWVEFINNDLPKDWKIIIAPHEIKADKIKAFRNSINIESILYSTNIKRSQNPVIGQNPNSVIERSRDNQTSTSFNSQLLIVDAIGFLSKVYASADVAYVGGGFNKSGVHNTLEPAVFGTPVIIGPNYDKFNEVKMLKEKGVIFPISNYAEFKSILLKVIGSQGERRRIQQLAQQVFHSQPLSTQIILKKMKDL